MPLTEQQKVQQKEYRIRNVEKRRQYTRNYVKINKDALNQPVTCCCGVTVKRINMWAHKRSQRHQIFTGQKIKNIKTVSIQIDDIDFVINFDA